MILISKKIDMLHKTFNRLTVVEELGTDKDGRTLWRCECSCGNNDNVIVTGKSLRSENTKSCGCLQTESRKMSKKKYNTYDLSGEYGIGYTTKGEEFYFDLEDYNKISNICWCKNKQGYIYSSIDKKRISLHRLIMNVHHNSKNDVDHINHNKCDNRRLNLRVVSRSNNIMNAGIRPTNTSGVTGVCWDNSRDKWIAYIKKNQKFIFLGYYNIFSDAVNVRKDAEEEYFGEFSYENSMELNKEKEIVND